MTRRRSVRLLIALLLGVLALGALSRWRPVLAGLEGAEAPESNVSRWVDPAALTPVALPEGVDPRWGEALDRLFAAHSAFRSDDAEALAALAAAVEAVPCVAEVRAARVEPGALDAFEDALLFDLRFHEPLACIATAAGYLTVAADGTVLNGIWPAPPRAADGRWLPVVHDDPDRPAFELARPGDWLERSDHADALDVALSMRAHFAPGTAALLGRVVVDATRGRRASPDEPGVRLLLDDGRVALFGRPPGMGEPGELPVARKWRGLARALEAPVADAWDLVDLRWDVPELRLAPGVELALGSPHEDLGGEPGSSAAGSAASSDAARSGPIHRPRATDPPRESGNRVR